MCSYRVLNTSRIFIKESSGNLEINTTVKLCIQENVTFIDIQDGRYRFNFDQNFVDMCKNEIAKGFDVLIENNNGNCISVNRFIVMTSLSQFLSVLKINHLTLAKSYEKVIKAS